MYAALSLTSFSSGCQFFSLSEAICPCWVPTPQLAALTPFHPFLSFLSGLQWRSLMRQVLSLEEVLSTELDDLRLISGAHMVEGED